MEIILYYVGWMKKLGKKLKLLYGNHTVLFTSRLDEETEKEIGTPVWKSYCTIRRLDEETEREEKVGEN